MHVGLIAPPWLSVPAPGYGGTELIVDQLARGVSALGCDVTLFTTGDSTCPVRRRWLYERGLGTTELAECDELTHVEAAYGALADVDVIHDHTLAGPRWAARHHAGPPVLATVHGTLVGATRTAYAEAAHHVGVIAISSAQRRTAPEIPVAAVIHHGIDIESYPIGAGDGGYVAFLGRMSPEKGAHRAIDVARRAGVPIVLAAKVWEQRERRYFDDVVEPLLGPDAVYVGEVGGGRKAELLGGAAALLNPIRWDEPFGLVMVEALACGTPVLTFAEGSAPELVEHGRTGYVCADEDDMVRALRSVGRLDRASCRRSAVLRFSAARMVADHVALYLDVIGARDESASDVAS